MSLRSFLISIVALAGAGNYAQAACPFTVYATDSVLTKEWFSPPPSGYGVQFPWPAGAVAEAVKGLSWKGARTGSVSPTLQQRLRNGSASYLLIAYQPAQCENGAGSPSIAARQAHYLGSYLVAGVEYLLFAQRGLDGSYNESYDYAATGLFFSYVPKSVAPFTGAGSVTDPDLVYQGTLSGNGQAFTLAAQQTLRFAPGEFLRVSVSGNPAITCGPLEKLESDDKTAVWKVEKTGGTEQAYTVYFTPSTATTVRRLTVSMRKFFGFCDVEIRKLTEDADARR